jgi:protein-disulfide isomerase
VSTRVKDRKAAAKVVREQLARERRRRRTVLSTAVAVAVLVIAGMVGWSVVAGRDRADGPTPPGAVAGGTGFARGSGPVTVDVYSDFLCPNCRNFEQQAGATLDGLVAANRITLVYHPIAILDRLSTTAYSTRSAAAAGAAAEGGKFWEFAKALYQQQPAEGGPGLADDKLVEMGRSVGLGDDFADKVRGGTYRAWVTRATESAAREGYNSTPTVVVAGKRLDLPSPAGITAAVEAAAK